MTTSLKFESYDAAVSWLFVQLPNYQKEGLKAYKPGLETILALLLAIDDPHNKFKSIHLAGTNGKGSVAHMLASVYQTAGYKVGIFTSPHISDFRERIKINGQLVSEQLVLDFVNQNAPLIQELNATFFEITTALAFSVFAKEQVDLAIIETGLGGRLDSTNVLTPIASVITNIGLDHQQFLGDTLALIAKEKAGIIKPGVPVIVGKKQKETEEVFEQVAQKNNSTLLYAVPCDYPSDLLGLFQEENKATVFTTIEILQEELPVRQRDVQEGLLQVAEETNFKGRFQQIGSEPLTIVDAAHNLDGVKNLMSELSHLTFDELHLIYGASNDKDVQEIIDLLPKSAHFYFVEFDSPRSVKSDQFEELGKQNKLSVSTYKGSAKALESAQIKATKKDLILLFGSFYIMSEII
ncbi:MAG: folylpolyglutamate synthase/dihydrofolate synthase family protein [Crocinitomicaceae bacterium]